MVSLDKHNWTPDVADDSVKKFELRPHDKHRLFANKGEEHWDGECCPSGDRHL